MISVTFLNLTTGKKRLQFFQSIDAVKKDLNFGKYDSKMNIYVVPRGKYNESVYAVSYDQNDEVDSYFRRVGILPPLKSYPEERGGE